MLSFTGKPGGRRCWDRHLPGCMCLCSWILWEAPVHHPLCRGVLPHAPGVLSPNPEQQALETGLGVADVGAATISL